MNSKPWSLGPQVFAAGLVAGLMAGWSGGCSRSGSANVNVMKGREAFAKRRSDYGEAPRIQSRVRDKSPAQHK
jgi:hypothetical protein